MLHQVRFPFICELPDPDGPQHRPVAQRLVTEGGDWKTLFQIKPFSGPRPPRPSPGIDGGGNPGWNYAVNQQRGHGFAIARVPTEAIGSAISSIPRASTFAMVPNAPQQP
jgi:hypothetical protein